MTHDLPPGCRLVPISAVGDANGVQGGKDVPFDIQAVYYFYGAQKNALLDSEVSVFASELAIAAAGTRQIVLNAGQGDCRVNLNQPSLGLLIAPMVTRRFTEFSENCVLMLFSSAPTER